MSKSGQENLPINPALMRLIHQKREAIRNDVSANGHLSVTKKAEQRAEYAQMISKTEGRAVREYQEATPEGRKAQKKKSRDKKTTAEQSAARKARRHAAKKREQDEAAAAIAARTFF